MADGTYMGHGWCLIIDIDGQTGEVLDRRWCAHESKAAYLALFSRLPAPDVLITDGLRGAEAACTQAWPGTRIQRCLVHVQRNTRTDLTSRPRLQAGRELKRLSDRLASVGTAGQAVRWGEALNAWHERWKDFIAERTYARDDPSNPRRRGTGGGGRTRSCDAATGGWRGCSARAGCSPISSRNC